MENLQSRHPYIACNLKQLPYPAFFIPEASALCQRGLHFFKRNSGKLTLSLPGEM